MHKFGRVVGTPERSAWPSAHHRTGRAYRTACRHTPWSTAKSRECLFAPCAHPTHPPHEGPVRDRTALHAHLRRRLRGATHGARPERLPTPPGRRPTRLVRPPRGDAPHTRLEIRTSRESDPRSARASWGGSPRLDERRAGGTMAREPISARLFRLLSCCHPFLSCCPHISVILAH